MFAQWFGRLIEKVLCKTLFYSFFSRTIVVDPNNFQVLDRSLANKLAESLTTIIFENGLEEYFFVAICEESTPCQVAVFVFNPEGFQIGENKGFEIFKAEIAQPNIFGMILSDGKGYEIGRSCHCKNPEDLMEGSKMVLMYALYESVIPKASR